MKVNKIPNYWLNHINKKIDCIRKIQLSCKGGFTSFALITDIHWRYNIKNSAPILEKVLLDCNIPYYFNAGDIVSGVRSHLKEDIINDLQEFKKAFSETESKCLIAFGNHDASYSLPNSNAYYDMQLSTTEIYKNLLSFGDKYQQRVYGGDKSYYYVDNYIDKIRYVILCNHDLPTNELDDNGKPIYSKMRTYTMLSDQINWFAFVALNLPCKDWSVILCSHETAISKDFNELSPNYPILLNIINAFKNSEKFVGSMSFNDTPYLNVSVNVDYTKGGGNFIGWVGGHMHTDEMITVNGITSVTTFTDSSGGQDGNVTPHIPNTDKEQSFDVFTVDKLNRKVYITRIGLGKDREFNY